MDKLIIVSLLSLISACGATQAPPYQEDRQAKDRDQYSGLEGLKQQQKDQHYLMNNELSERCENAKVSLAVAQTNHDHKETNKQKDIIADTCI